MKIHVAMAVLMFAFVATVYGGATLQFTANPAPAPGLESYTITVVSTDGSNLVTFSDIHIDDPVHNVWGFGNDPVTTMAADFPSTFLKAEWAAYDTHLLVPESDMLTQLGSPLDEGNDGSNPAGLSLELDPPFAGFLPVVGVGASSFALVPAAQATSVDLFQMVATEGSVRWGWGSPSPICYVVNERLERFPLYAPPEPATVSLLALGSLVLLRRRKRR